MTLLDNYAGFQAVLGTGHGYGGYSWGGGYGPSNDWMNYYMLECAYSINVTEWTWFHPQGGKEVIQFEDFKLENNPSTFNSFGII